MIRIVIADIQPLYPLFEGNSPKRTVSEAGSLGARRLIDLLLCDKYPRPRLLKDKNGRPYLSSDCEGSTTVSISHCDRLVAVALAGASDSASVGVDIEPQFCGDKAERLSNRFTDNVNIDLQNLSEDIQIYIAKLDPCQENDSLILFESNEDNIKVQRLYTDGYSSLPFTDKWTVLEASLKALGGGFGDYGKIKDGVNARVARYSVYLDREYSLSLVAI